MNKLVKYFAFFMVMVMVSLTCGCEEEETYENVYPAEDEYVLYFVSNDGENLVIFDWREDNEF